MISIIIPTRNEEKIIERTLKHLKLSLGDLPHELIVSDGSSTDRTRDIASAFATVIEETDGRHTIGWGRNRGADAAKGDIFFFLDADVTVPKPADFIQRIQRTFDTDPRLAGLTGELRVLPAQATRGDRLVFGAMNLYFRFLNNVLGYGMASGEFQVIRAKAFKELGGFREDLAAAEDAEFFRRVSKKYKVRFAPEFTLFHTGRRAHAVGWPNLLWSWFKNWVGATFLKGAVDKEWTAVR
jgi:glycosyltransferase involved in cell wall biosynthesis